MKTVTASWIVPVSSAPVAGGSLTLDDGRIASVGTTRTRAEGTGVDEYPGCIVIPGLVNAHTHLELTHFPAWKIRKGFDDLPENYVDWAMQVIKIRRGLTRDELLHSVREGLRICLESGTTTIGEILTDWSLMPEYHGSSLRGTLFLEIIAQDSLYAENLLQRLEATLSEQSEGDFTLALSPHTPFTVSERVMERVAALAKERKLRKAIHLAEPPEEAEFMFDSSGAIAERLYPFVRWDEHLPPPRRTTSTAYLEARSILDEGTAAIHAVHLTPADAGILRRRGCGVVLCPRSNRQLNVGTAPAHLFHKYGIPLALGTDSLASNDSLSMFDEMRELLETWPEVFSPADALRLATLDGARLLGCGEATGSLQEGKRGDFLVLRPKTAVTGSTLHESIIYDSDIEAVYCGGGRVL